MNEVNKTVITYNNKMAKLGALYIRWAYKNIEKETLIKEALHVRQCNRYKELRLIVFIFTLYKVQVEVI